MPTDRASRGSCAANQESSSLGKFSGTTLSDAVAGSVDPQDTPCQIVDGDEGSGEQAVEQSVPSNTEERAAETEPSSIEEGSGTTVPSGNGGSGGASSSSSGNSQTQPQHGPDTTMPVRVEWVEPPANSKQLGVQSSLLYNGSKFKGSQKSKGNSYDVEVVLQVRQMPMH